MRRYKHNLSHFRNTTSNMGQLVPVGVVPVLQGDTFKHNTNMFMRVSPLAYPVMHPVHSHLHHIFVPYRLLWEQWESFITGGEDFLDASVMPTITFDGVGANPPPITVGSLGNQLGLPVGFNGTVNALWFRAYAFIYNELIRDQQLQAPIGLSLAGGPDTTTNTSLKQANWSKDYYVSARPDDTLGPDVTIPLGTAAPVEYGPKTGAIPPTKWRVSSTGAAMNSAEALEANAAGGIQLATTNVPLSLDPNGALFANLALGVGPSLDDLRLAIATSQWQESINKTGNKYSDYLRRYGVRYSDARLQRPETLAFGKQTVQFSEVIQTAPDAGGDGVGKLAGHGIAAMRSNSYIQYFEEPGVVMTLMSVKPIPMYMQALQKEWFKRTKEEFYQKEFEVLGMQEIENREIKWNHANPTGTFGYGPRYDEYKRIPNTVHAEFETLFKDMHMAREFATDPALNGTFVSCVPTDRIYQEKTTAQLQMTVQHKLAARRLLSNSDQPSKLVI